MLTAVGCGLAACHAEIGGESEMLFQKKTGKAKTAGEDDGSMGGFEIPGRDGGWFQPGCLHFP